MKREEETTYPCYKPVRKTKKHIAEEAKRFSFLYPSESKEMFFIYGAEWADKTMLDRACEWLKENIDLYSYNAFNTKSGYTEITLTDEFETAFRQAMKGE
jgi:hypothetical protein